MPEPTPSAAMPTAGNDTDLSPTAATSGLRRAYHFGLGVLAALAIGGQVLVQRSLNEQAGDAGVINAAGLQRSRSERIAKELLAIALVDTPGEGNTSELRLRTTVSLFEQTRVDLLQGDASLGLEPITDPEHLEQYLIADAIYVEFIGAVNQSLEAFAAGDKADGSTRAAITAQRQYFGEMNGLVKQLDKTAQADLAATRTLQAMLLIATLLALATLGFGSFRPAIRRLGRSVRLFEALSENSPEALLLVDSDGVVFHKNPAAMRLLGDLAPGPTQITDLLADNTAATDDNTGSSHTDLSRPDGTVVPVRVSTTGFEIEANTRARLYLIGDRTEEIAAEKRHRQAEKLEAIGVLAAGIAHEINTPTQFVRDNLTFIEESVVGLLAVTGQVEAAAAGPEAARDEAWSEMSEKLDQIDAEFIREELESSIKQSMDGMSRVAEIVRAMKDFSQPGADGIAPADINDALTSTSIVCRSEWGPVADLDLDLSPELPKVPVQLGDIKQVFLNLIVNAAQAIGGQQGSEEPGRIVVRTYVEDDHAVIEISDNGPGIPSDLHQRVFEPFFTTKEVGQGTGQGLAISQRVVTEDHQGSIAIAPDLSEDKTGTTLRICLPLVAPQHEEAPAAAPALTSV